MPTVTITIYIEASAAVRAGSNVCGATPLRLTADDLAELSPDEMDTLARHIDGEDGPYADGPHWGDPIWQCVRAEDLARHCLTPGRWPAFADLPTLRTLLAIRRRVMHDALARANAAIYQVWTDGSISPPITDAAMARANYIAERKRYSDARVRRVDGVIVVSADDGLTVDVAAAKLWHRAAAMPPSAREIGGAS